MTKETTGITDLLEFYLAAKDDQKADDFFDAIVTWLVANVPAAILAAAFSKAAAGARQ